MTVHATRVENKPTNVKVNITYGPVTASVEEDYQHLRTFHNQLGSLIAQIDSEQE